MKDFEYSILKNLIEEPEYFTKVFGLLHPKYFEDSGARGLFKLLKEYYAEYKNIPGILELATKIKDTSNADTRSILVSAVKKLNEHQAEFKELEFLLNETVMFIKDALYLEGLTVGAEGLEKKSDDLKAKSKRIFDEMYKISIDDNISLDFDDIEDIIAHFSSKDVGLLTKHKEFDSRLGAGLLPGTLNMIMAAQGVGKSLLMCDIASSLLTQNKNVLIVSLEMADYEMMKRIYANVLDVDIATFAEMPDSEAAQEEVRTSYNTKRMSGTLGKVFVKDYPATSFSALMLEGLIQRFKQEKNITFDAVIVDYVGIMKSDLVTPSSGLYSYIKSISEELRATAKKLGIAVISASQLGRSAINKTEDVDNSAIADSIGIAATADMIVMILQNEEMKSNSEVLIKFTKNRYTGKTDCFMMGVDYHKMRFVSLAQEFSSGAQKESAITFADSVVKQHEANVSTAIANSAKQTTNTAGDMESFLKDLGI